MAIFTSESDIENLKEAGQRLAFVLDEVAKGVRPGVTEKELDKKARHLIEARGDTSAFLGYTPDDGGATKPYPATLCISVNDDVVHGVPTDKAIKEGDIVSLDVGLAHKGVVVDMAKTYAIGEVNINTKRLIHATEESLREGIAAVRAGGRIGDIGNAIETHIKKAGFAVVRELGGHGVGKKVHESPFIPNYGTRGKGALLEEGMVLALEPIATNGSSEVEVSDDGYTYKTRDGSIAAHFEHTILVTKDGAKIITSV